MVFFNKKIKKKILAILIAYLFLINPGFSQNTKTLDEIDLLRADLTVISDKNSPNYIKTKQKLNKLIKQSKIEYSHEYRLEDIKRLMAEQKFNSAVYEINSLIEENYNLSVCYELLADIKIKANADIKSAANCYKLSIQNNPDNISALYKLAKLYLREKRNILGIETLKTTIEKTENKELLENIEDIVKNKIRPQNRYEANNLYEALGNIYFKLNREDDCYYAFLKAIQLNPSDIFLKYHLADLFYENNHNNDAIVMYDSILADNPTDTQIRVSKAKSLGKTGNLLSANKEYLMVLSKYPNSNQAKYGIFKIYENKMSPDKILEKIYSEDKTFQVNSKECRKFAKFLAQMNDNNGSMMFNSYADKLDKIELEKIAIQKTKEQQIKKEKELKEKKEIAKKEDKKDIAKNIAQKPTKKENPTQKEIVNDDKKVIQKDLNLKKQQKELQDKKAKEEKIQQEKIKQAKAKKEKEEREYQKRAIKAERQKAIAKDPKNYQKYKIQLDKYLKMNPKDVQIYTAIANTYKLMGEPTSAIINYKEALKIDPVNSDLYYNLGLTYLELNSAQTAKAHLSRAINLDKNNEKAINLLKFVNQKIITQTLNLAYGEYEKKNYIKALSILDKGTKEYPLSAQMFYYRALVYDAMNRNGAQIIDLQKAIELDPSYYMAYYQLGRAYEKIDDERSALVAYERFLSIEPDEKELIEEIQKKVISLGDKYY